MQPGYRIPDGFPNAKNGSTDGSGIIRIRGSADLSGFGPADGNVKSTVESEDVTTIQEGGEEIDKTAVLPTPIKIRKAPVSCGMSLGGVHLSSARRLADEDQNQDARRSTPAVSADNQYLRAGSLTSTMAQTYLASRP